MPLPKLDKPLFEMKIPSQGKVVTFRPFVVKEEKILLIAQQSDSDRDIAKALMQILQNCIIDEGFDATKLTTFDLEYMFLKLRSKSVNNISKQQFRDNEDEKIYDFDIDLDDVDIVETPEHTNKIKINDTSGIVMKYPTAMMADSAPDGTDELAFMDFMIRSCIETIYSGDDLYTPEEYTPEELQEFIDNLPISVYEQIREFFVTMPKMYYAIEYVNSLGTERKIELTSLRDFFTWG